MSENEYINWQYHTWLNERLASEEQVSYVEDQLSFKFPPLFRDILKKHQGKTPDKYCILINNGYEEVFSNLLHVDETKNHGNLLQISKIVWDTAGIPKEIIPFGNVGDGSYFCFDYRYNKENPKVVFLASEEEGEEAIYPVADDFIAFMGMLYIPEND